MVSLYPLMLPFAPVVIGVGFQLNPPFGAIRLVGVPARGILCGEIGVRFPWRYLKENGTYLSENASLERVGAVPNMRFQGLKRAVPSPLFP